MEILNEQNRAEYEQFLRTHPKGNFAQSPEWARVKTAWQSEAVIVRDAEGRIKGTASVLIRRMPLLHYGLAYSSRGPVCDIHYTETLHELISDLKELAKSHKCYLLKIDPDVPVSETEFEHFLESEGFVCRGRGKNFEGIQPRFVFRLYLNGRTEEEIMASFHSKTRYNIRVAIKKGVTVKIETRDKLKDFYEIMLETGMRDNFVTRPLSYFERMYDELGDDVRLYMAYYEGKPIAGTLAIHYGDKVWYLYGASSNAYRNVMPNYLLQWEMIRWAIETGARVYDFRGVSGDIDESNPLYGLYRFKKGFNGELTEFVGEYDLVLSKPVKTFYDVGEKVYKKCIKTVYKLKNRDKAVK